MPTPTTDEAPAKPRKYAPRGASRSKSRRRVRAGRSNSNLALNDKPITALPRPPLTFPTMLHLQAVWPGGTQALLDLVLLSADKLCLLLSAQANWASGKGLYVVKGKRYKKGEIIGLYCGDLLTRKEAEMQRTQRIDTCTSSIFGSVSTSLHVPNLAPTLSVALHPIPSRPRVCVCVCVCVCLFNITDVLEWIRDSTVFIDGRGDSDYHHLM